VLLRARLLQRQGEASSRRRNKGGQQRAEMSIDPLTEILNDPRFKGAPITWEFPP